MKFLDDMYGPDVLRTLKKIERKRHDVRRRLINEQVQFVFFARRALCRGYFSRQSANTGVGHPSTVRARAQERK